MENTMEPKEKNKEIFVTRLEIVFKKPVVEISERVGETDRWGKTHVYLNESSNEFTGTIVDVPTDEVFKYMNYFQSNEYEQHNNIDNIIPLGQFVYEILGKERDVTEMHETMKIDGEEMAIKRVRKVE